MSSRSRARPRPTASVPARRPKSAGAQLARARVRVPRDPQNAAATPTGRLLLDTALALFRKKGFDETTMRDIAAEAGMALGAAYYYFPSKEAMLLAFYERRRIDHERRAHEALAGLTDLRGRVGAVMHAGLDVSGPDRKLLAALARSLGDPLHPLSVFGSQTRGVREKSIGLFAEALGGTDLPDDLRALAASAFWMLYLGVILYFVHDASPHQKRTRTLVDGALDLSTTLMQLAALPGMEGLRAQALQIAADAGLFATQGAGGAGAGAGVLAPVAGTPLPSVGAAEPGAPAPPSGPSSEKTKG